MQRDFASETKGLTVPTPSDTDVTVRLRSGSMADLRDPLLSTIGDIHAHPTNGRFALLGYPG